MRDRLDAVGIASVAGDTNEELSRGPSDAICFGNTPHMHGPEENVALCSPG